jgi:hypothetical protein
MPPALLALFLLVGSFGVITIATLSYVFFHRAETRFALVISFLTVCVILILSPLIFLQPFAFSQGSRNLRMNLSNTASRGGHCLFPLQRPQLTPSRTEEENGLLMNSTPSAFRPDHAGAHCNISPLSPLP